ncbi:hypothetical protein BROUX41_000600 [Berkeleyomyces rouxiae]|uniref:uncharacterized protein n=1 Tax=Berkeleyomyces rouxiae TaxID=2035830 RepID=UPI003B776FFB
MTALPKVPVPLDQLAQHIADHPETGIASILSPYRTYENEIRALYAQNPTHPALKDPHANVLPLFPPAAAPCTTRARDLAAESAAEKDRYIMALPPRLRRAHGSPATVSGLSEFRKNFAIFSEQSLADLDWSNVVAAGSSVVNCLLPVPPEFQTSKKKLREYYHERFCPASDVDLFLYGLTPEQALDKIAQIERAVRDALLTEVTVVRTKYAITLASQYPTRHIQIVLRIYKSVSEILTGFDIDASGAAYDGSQVYVTPRALGSYITQINHIDMSRRSPSYENRLSKYSHRNFEVYWPELDRSRVDPTIYERSFRRTLGLARLLVLERLPTTSVRKEYIDKRRAERGRPAANTSVGRSANIKDMHEDEVAEWMEDAEVSNYHTFTVPYGPFFNSKRIEKMCYTRDLLLNAEWNQPKNRSVYLHRHPAFFGRFEDVMKDCCGSCPPAVTADELEVAAKEDQVYIRGPISFIIDDPGRQQIGSFHPLTAEDWTDMAYIGSTGLLCQAIADDDLEAVRAWIALPGANPDERDYTGRTPLHLAVTCASAEIVRALVGAGVRITARVADGRSALHMAVERGSAEMVRILMERSLENEDADQEKQLKRRRTLLQERASGAETEAKDGDDLSDSDGELVEADQSEVISLATGSFVKVEKSSTGDEDAGGLDATDEPDFYKNETLAWDIPNSPMHIAIAEGHEDIVKLLHEFGVSVLLPMTFKYDDEITGCLTTLMMALKLPLPRAISMVRLLVSLGAISSHADYAGYTGLLRFTLEAPLPVFEWVMANDKIGVSAALNHPRFSNNSYDSRGPTPLLAALHLDDSAKAKRLLEAGAEPELSFNRWIKSGRINPPAYFDLDDHARCRQIFNANIDQPIIVALSSCLDLSLAEALIERGADINTMNRQGYEYLRYSWVSEMGSTVLDLIRDNLSSLQEYDSEADLVAPKTPEPVSEKLYTAHKEVAPDSYRHWVLSGVVAYEETAFETRKESYDKAVKKHLERTANADLQGKKTAIEEAIVVLQQLEKIVLEKGGKTFVELHPDAKKGGERQRGYWHARQSSPADTVADPQFALLQAGDVSEAGKAAYLEIFEAAWTGDLETITKYTTKPWGPTSSEPPLLIAVSDKNHNTPFSLAFSRGHMSVAQEILAIAQLQYAPQQKEQATKRMLRHADDHNDDSSCGPDYSDEDVDTEDEHAELPTLVKVPNASFEMLDVGEVANVHSKHSPYSILISSSPFFDRLSSTPKAMEMERGSLYHFLIRHDRVEDANVFLDLCLKYAPLEKDGEGEPRVFDIDEDDFIQAISAANTSILETMITKTGAGIPVDRLVKAARLDAKDPPRFYQGLTVYGKKRKDWATHGRAVLVRDAGVQRSPLLIAAENASLNSVRWLLTDAPREMYLHYAASDAAKAHPSFKHLVAEKGAFEAALDSWMRKQANYVLHCAVMSQSGQQAALDLVDYLLEQLPKTLELPTSSGNTPLLLACRFGQVEVIQRLARAGANQLARNYSGNNILHELLASPLPKAPVLKTVLDSLDQKVLRELLKQRNHLDSGGLTPVHVAFQSLQCIRPITPDDDDVFENGWTQDCIFRFLHVFLEYLNADGTELEMLNATGDTVMHNLVTDHSWQLVDSLAAFQPRLLVRENATGRTPAEAALAQRRAAMYVESRTAYQILDDAAIGNPDHRQGVISLLTKPPGWTAAKEAEERAKHRSVHGCSGPGSSNEDVTLTWLTCAAYVSRGNLGRRLVSLNEANDVVNRLGDKYVKQRYYDRAIGRTGPEDSGDANDDKDEDYVKNMEEENKRNRWRVDEVYEARETEKPAEKEHLKEYVPVWRQYVLDTPSLEGMI